MADQLVGLLMGQHFGLGVELGLVAAVVHLGVPRHHNDDGLVLHLEAEALGNAGALHTHGHRRQLHRGGGDIELPDSLFDAEGLEICSDFFNGHDGSFLSI